jgi:hypothetical protein
MGSLLIEVLIAGVVSLGLIVVVRAIATGAFHISTPAARTRETIWHVANIAGG